MPVVGYSLAYPVGVLGMIAALSLARRWIGVDGVGRSNEGVSGTAEAASGRGDLTNRTVEITNPLIIGFGPDEVSEHSGIDVVFGRMRERGADVSGVERTRFLLGDLVSVVVAGADRADDGISGAGGRRSDRV